MLYPFGIFHAERVQKFDKLYAAIGIKGAYNHGQLFQALFLGPVIQQLIKNDGYQVNIYKKETQLGDDVFADKNQIGKNRVMQKIKCQDNDRKIIASLRNQPKFFTIITLSILPVYPDVKCISSMVYLMKAID